MRAVALTLLLAGTAAAEPAPLVVFHAPESGGCVAGARAGLERVAVERGAALLDLSPPAPRLLAPVELRRGIDAYEALRLDEAWASLAAAQAEAAQSGGAGLASADLSDLHLYRAVVRQHHGDEAGAWEELVAAAVVDPGRVLDPLRFPPRVVEAFARAAAAVQARAPGAFVVDAPGCAVLVDGRAVASAAPLPVAAGRHYVRVECPGQIPDGGHLEILPGAPIYRPLPRRVAAPPDGVAVALGRERGAATVLLALVVAAPGAPPTLRLSLRRTDDGTELAAAICNCDEAATAAAAARLLAPPAVPAAPLPLPAPPRRPRWYERPWVWGVVGAAAAAAVLLPFALGSDGPSGFDVEVRR